MRLKLGMIAALWLALVTGAVAQTLVVTSPTDGSFIGLSNQIKFTVTGAVVEVHIDIVATGPGGVQFTNSGDFTPDGEGRIINNLQLNFNQGVPEGAYSILVTATEPGQTYAPVTVNVTLDVTKPKFLQFNPITDTFVRGIVPIQVLVQEPNFKDYRVQVDGQDIPNNTGTTLVGNEFTVLWDTTGLEFDGSRSISIRLRDQADNEETRTFDVIVDRVNPTATIIQPRSDIRLAARSHVAVAIDIVDGQPNSVDISGIDVVARKLTGEYLGRVAVRSFRNTTGATNRWTGRLRYRSIYPKEFKLIVTLVDKAGNFGIPQEVIVKYR